MECWDEQKVSNVILMWSFGIILLTWIRVRVKKNVRLKQKETWFMSSGAWDFYTASTLAPVPTVHYYVSTLHCFTVFASLESVRTRVEERLVWQRRVEIDEKQKRQRREARHHIVIFSSKHDFFYNMLWSLNPYFSNVLQIWTFFCNGISRHFLYLIFYKYAILKYTLKQKP